MEEFRKQQILDHLEKVVKTGELLESLKADWEASTDYEEFDDIDVADRRKIDLIRRYEEGVEEESFEVSVTAGDNGSVAGGGTFTSGTVITIAAVPDEGYIFEEWDDESTDNPREITVSEDVSIEASFVSE